MSNDLRTPDGNPTRRLVGDDNTCRYCEGDGLGYSGDECRECRGTGLHWPEGIALGCRRQLTGNDLEIIRLAAWGLYDDIKADPEPSRTNEIVERIRANARARGASK